MKQLKRPEKHAGGFLPANHYPWEGAYIFFRPNYGIVRVAFGNGMNSPCDEDGFGRDENGHKVDDNVYITYYSDLPEEGVFKRYFACLSGLKESRSLPGVFFKETDGFNMLISHKSYPSADLRDLLKPALKCIDLPVDVERRYYLIGTEGKFNWDGRPTRRARKSK